MWIQLTFRSIGGGRFEALYKEVLPILQEMLDTLSHLLQHATDDTERDLFVELTLTVPVRLTNLLPHLSYLMKPLVHALRAGPDSVSQGLRTLELCIDNLTADFLDPTMGPILRELMAALHRLLKPVPASRHHAQSAIRILGKLGGRNRRFQEVENLLEYTSTGADMSVPIYIEGKSHTLQLGPIVNTAAIALEEGVPEHAEDSLKILMIAAMTVLEPVSAPPLSEDEN
jgi:transformation/transcription domain-associated protein